jgi:hypothetical protein
MGGMGTHAVVRADLKGILRVGHLYANVEFVWQVGCRRVGGIMRLP